MVQRLIENARRHVRDAADAQHTHAAVARDHDLRHGAHAYRVRAKGAQHADFRGRFIRRAGHLRINAFAQCKALLARTCMRQRAQFLVKCAAHIREARSELVEVRTDERVLRRQAEHIADDHQIAGMIAEVHAARRVGDDQRLDADFLHHAHGQGDILHAVSLVVMEAALHHHHALAVQRAAAPHARVARDGRAREAGDFAVRQFNRVFQRLGVIAQPAAQNNADFSLTADSEHLFRRVVDSLHFVHRFSP